jgi:hypothetical protein
VRTPGRPPHHPARTAALNCRKSVSSSLCSAESEARPPYAALIFCESVGSVAMMMHVVRRRRRARPPAPHAQGPRHAPIAPYAHKLGASAPRLTCVRSNPKRSWKLTAVGTPLLGLLLFQCSAAGGSARSATRQHDRSQYLLAAASCRSAGGHLIWLAIFVRDIILYTWWLACY